MPKKSPKRRRKTNATEQHAAPVRSFWSGTITFGLVSIPVDLVSATRPRQKSMKLVDKSGHALGRRYHCSKDGKKLTDEDLVRGYETDSGKVVTLTDEELESVAPESSREIDLRRFVPLDQIPRLYYERSYFLAPAGGSVKAYNLLAQTMERMERAGIGTFVMRGHEYLTAILSENGVLRADTLRRSNEIRKPEDVGLPEGKKVASKSVERFATAIEGLTRDALDMAEFEDEEAEALHHLAEAKHKKGEDVIELADLEDEDGEGGAQIIDLMEVLRKTLSKNAVVSTAESSTEPRSAKVIQHPRAKRRASR